MGLVGSVGMDFGSTSGLAVVSREVSKSSWSYVFKVVLKNVLFPFPCCEWGRCGRKGLVVAGLGPFVLRRGLGREWAEGRGAGR